MLVVSLGKTARSSFRRKKGEALYPVAPQMDADQKIMLLPHGRHAVYHCAIERGVRATAWPCHRGRDRSHGDFDFTLDLTPDESRPNPLDPSLILSAMREQLGFTVKSQKAPVDLLVIDSVEKVAAGN